MHDTTDMKISWELLKQFPKQRILVIADPNNPPITYLDMLVKMGYDMIWVGCGAEGFPSLNVNLGRYEPKIVPYPESFGITTKQFEFSIQGLLNFINMDISLILHFQNWWMPIDRKKSPVPYIYIPSETWYPKVPNCAWGTTYCNIVMKEMIEKYHPNVPTIAYLPYPVNRWLEDLPIKKEYHHRSGFCGNLSLFIELYEERRKILFTLAEKLSTNEFQGHWRESKEEEPVKVEKMGKGSLECKDYTEFLQDCLMGISIPTPLGMPFRDLEVSAAGRCLLTKKVRDHKAMGFEEGIHYLAYDTVDELISLIKNTKEEKAYSIGKNANMLIKNAHYVWHRLPVIEMIMEKYGLTAHGKYLNYWKIKERKKGGSYILEIKKSQVSDEYGELFIGKDSYYPIGIHYAVD